MTFLQDIWLAHSLQRKKGAHACQHWTSAKKLENVTVDSGLVRDFFFSVKLTAETVSCYFVTFCLKNTNYIQWVKRREEKERMTTGKFWNSTKFFDSLKRIPCQLTIIIFFYRKRIGTKPLRKTPSLLAPLLSLKKLKKTLPRELLLSVHLLLKLKTKKMGMFWNILCARVFFSRKRNRPVLN